MKIINSNLISRWLIFAGFIALMPACTIDEQIDLNNPSLEGIESDATIDELNNLVTGMEADMRFRFDTYLDGISIIGRDYFRIQGADPRFTSDLAGAGSSQLDPNTFYITNPWSERYRVVRNGWILRHATANTTAALTQEEKNGYLGFAKTIQALEMLYNLSMTYDNGIRLDVEFPDNLGPVINDHNACLDGILALLNEGNDDLIASGDHFTFILSSGFANFSSPATFAQFNRALAARVKLYRGDDDNTVLAYLAESFYDPSADLYYGANMVYSTTGGDLLNAVFSPQNSPPSNCRIVVQTFFPDAEPNDTRVTNKTSVRDDTVKVNPTPGGGFDIEGNYDFWVYQSTIAPIPIIRNEELILINAEANIRLNNFSEAVTSINIVRAAAGLPDYSGGMDELSLTDELLKQRRYSLFGEGHRWIDMRRYNRLSELEVYPVGYHTYTQYPLPASED